MALQNIGRTIMQGSQNIAQSITQVRIAKAKLKQQKEQFDLEKKTKQSALKLAEKKGQLLDFEVQAEEKKLKARTQMYEAIDGALKAQEKKGNMARSNMNSFANGANTMAQQLIVNIAGQELIYDPEERAEGKAFPFDKIDSKQRLDMDLQKAFNGQISWIEVKKRNSQFMEEIEQAQDYYRDLKRQEEDLRRQKEQAVEVYGEAKASQLSNWVKKAQQAGRSQKEISELLKSKGINYNLFLK